MAANTLNSNSRCTRHTAVNNNNSIAKPHPKHGIALYNFTVKTRVANSVILILEYFESSKIMPERSLAEL